MPHDRGRPTRHPDSDCRIQGGNLGINALVEGLAAEPAPQIRVNAVSPSWTLTPFWRDLAPAQLANTQAHFEQRIPLRRLASMDERADA